MDESEWMYGWMYGWMDGWMVHMGLSTNHLLDLLVLCFLHIDLVVPVVS